MEPDWAVLYRANGGGSNALLVSVRYEPAVDFCKPANFFADSKNRAQELSNDVSFVIFGHKTWDLEGGGSN